MGGEQHDDRRQTGEGEELSLTAGEQQRQRHRQDQSEEGAARVGEQGRGDDQGEGGEAGKPKAPLAARAEPSREGPGHHQERAERRGIELGRDGAALGAIHGVVGIVGRGLVERIRPGDNLEQAAERDEARDHRDDEGERAPERTLPGDEPGTEIAGDDDEREMDEGSIGHRRSRRRPETGRESGERKQRDAVARPQQSRAPGPDRQEEDGNRDQRELEHGPFAPDVHPVQSPRQHGGATEEEDEEEQSEGPTCTPR